MAFSTTASAGGLDIKIGDGNRDGQRPAGDGVWGRARLLIAPGFGRLWAASVLVPVVALGLAGFWTWDNVVKAARGEMARTLDMVNGQMLHLLETQKAVMVAMQALVTSMSYQDMRTSERAHIFAMQTKDGTESVFTLGVVDPTGHIAVASEEGPLPKVDLASREYVSWWPAGTDRPARMYVSPVVINRVILNVEHRTQLQVHTSLPRLGPDGKPDGGIVTAAFLPSQIEAFFKQIAQTANTGFTILRDDGSLLASYPRGVATENESLPTDDLALTATAELRAALQDPAATVAPVFKQVGSLFNNFNLIGVRRVGGDNLVNGKRDPRQEYDMDIIHRLDPAVAQGNWFNQMISPVIGALAAMTLLLVLTARAQARTVREQGELRARTQVAEEGQRLATERAEMESRLRQTEKVAALGQLAAGVAHDFNNLLQTIVLNGELLEATTGPDTPQARSAGLIIKASEGGIALTRRMLDYTRRDDRTAHDMPFDAANALRNVHALLSGSLGVRHRLRVSVPADLPFALGGDAEFESVIINLVVNARDAMEQGGDINIEAAAVTLADGSRNDLQPGRYVRVSVIDTGIGMDSATLARAGEAFFTTKARGQGTGLGLSMARGFARRSGGALDLASTPGEGTTVTLWLPAAS
jgi:signal transduction histidine kinase